MPLELQTVALPLGQGMNTKTDPKQVPLGEMLLVYDAVYTTPERLTKRNGYSSLDITILNGSGLTAGNALGVLRSSLTLMDGLSAYVYSPELSTWTTTGPAVASTVEANTYFTEAFGPNDARGAMLARDDNTGVEVVVHNLGYFAAPNGSTPHKHGYAAYDSQDNSVLSRGTIHVQNSYVDQLLTSQLVEKTANSKFWLLQIGSSWDLYYATAPASNPTFTTTGSALITGPFDDFDAATDGTYIFVVTRNQSTGAIGLHKVNASTLAVTTISVAGSTGTRPVIAVDSLGTNVWISWISGANVKYAVYSGSSLSVVHAPSTLAAMTAPEAVTMAVQGASTTAAFFIEEPVITQPYRPQVYGIKADTTGPTTSLTDIMYGAYLLSRPFFDANGYSYFWGLYKIADGRLVQDTFFLFQINPTVSAYATVIGKLAQGEAYGYQSGTDQTQYRNSVITRSSTEFVYPFLKQTQASFTFTIPVLTTGTATTTLGTKIRTQDLASSLHLSGGILSVYDGNITAEHGFMLFPEAVIGTPTGGGSMAVGTYSYTAVYSWTDAQGQVYRSAPALPTEVIVGGGSSAVDLEIPSLAISNKVTQPIQIEFYRTEAGGTPYYYAGSVINDYTQPTQTFSDVSSDALIISQRQLYTNGGELENIQPPAVLAMAGFKNRVFLIPSDRPFEVWYSKQVIPGTPVEFSDQFVLTLDQRGGDATALAAMDDKLVIFKERDLFYIVGDGPAPSGAANDLSYPQLIPSDCGCTEPSSIVLTPQGLMFKGDKGIYLLDRGLQLHYIGDKVESYNSQTITSAVLVPDANQVRFTVNSATLVYDYYVNKWSVFRLSTGVDAVSYDGNYTYLKADGQALQETPGVFSDDGAEVNVSFTTGWLSFAKIQGFQRVRRMLILGDYYTPNTLRVDVAYDFKSTITQATTITADTTAPYQWLLHFTRQKCEAMQLTFTEDVVNVPGQGLSLSSLMFEVGVKKNANKLKSARSVG